PDVRQASYEFRARIRHEQSELGGAGLFFGLRELPSSQGPVLFFYTVSFNDIEREEDHKDRNEKDKRDAPQPNRVSLNLNLYQEGSQGLSAPSLPLRTHRGGSEIPFWPTLKAERLGVWRHLTIQV